MSRSLGIDSRATLRDPGSTCTTMVTSLRCPTTVPKRPSVFALESEPTTNTLKGVPALAECRPGTSTEAI